MTSKRDRKLEQALKHELRNTGTPDRDACVDADTLAAWADGGLDAAQMAAVELHVSNCGRCQAIAGATARSAPAISPVMTERGFRFPKWALAPLAAAAAITIWMVVPQEPMQAPPAPAQVEAPKQVDASKQLAAPQIVEAPKKDAAPLTRNSASKEPQAKERGVAEERTADALGAVAAAPPPAAAAPPPAAPATLAETVRQKRSRLAGAPLEILSPDPSSRWRIVNNSIERSEDGGASWVPIRAPGGDTFSGGASPSRSVCWLIGSSGLVMVTADGIAFTRVPLPERADLTAIAATDARSATVTATDGRRFRTDDSGRTWRQIQAQ